MRNDHIITLLDEKRLGDLDSGDLSLIEAHTAQCHTCLRAYLAARASSTLLRARASETVEPSPFFKTRVMAAAREGLAAQQPAIVRAWRAASGLVSSMVAVVVILMAVTFFNAPESSSLEPATISTNLSAEVVVFEGGDSAAEDMGYEEVLGTVMYGEEDYEDN